MKKLIQSSILILCFWGIPKVASAQLTLCNPWECNPNPCYEITFFNNTNCAFDWISYYDGCSGSHPGFNVPVYPGTGPRPKWTLACMKCGDNPNCDCPLWIKLVDPGVGVIDNWGDLSNWTWSETVYDNIPYGDCECGGSYELKITIRITGVNQAEVIIDCS